MSYEIAEFDRRLSSLMQAGTIEAVDYLSRRCRVRVDDWVSAWMPWASLGAGKVRHWRPPSRGEQALLLCPSGESSAGWVLPGFYTDQHQGNDDREEITAQDWPDGAREEYDHENHRYLFDLPAGGTYTLRCGPVVFELSAEGVKITGLLTVSEDVIAGLISLIGHVHGGILRGGAQTDAPQ